MLDTVVLSLIFWNGVELIILNGKSRKWERVPAIVYNVDGRATLPKEKEEFMNFEIKVLDQFVNEEGSDQEKACWNKIKAAMCDSERPTVVVRCLAITKEDL